MASIATCAGLLGGGAALLANVPGQADDPASVIAGNSIRRANLAESFLAQDVAVTTAVCRRRLILQKARVISLSRESEYNQDALRYVNRRAQRERSGK